MTAFTARDGSSRLQQNPTLVEILTRLLPNRPTEIPVTGIEQTAPSAELKSAKPKTKLLRCSALWMAGMREIQVATTKPWTRNNTTVPHHAARVVLLAILPANVDCYCLPMQRPRYDLPEAQFRALVRRNIRLPFVESL